MKRCGLGAVLFCGLALWGDAGCTGGGGASQAGDAGRSSQDAGTGGDGGASAGPTDTAMSGSGGLAGDAASPLDQGDTAIVTVEAGTPDRGGGGGGGGPARLLLVAGGGNTSSGVPAMAAKLNGPFGIAKDRTGVLYVSEETGNRVFKIDTAGLLTTVVGNGAVGNGGDGGPGAQAQVNAPHDIGIAPGTDDLYIADTYNRRVRKLALNTGIISAVAGSGQMGSSADNVAAVGAQLGSIYSLAFSPTGSQLYLSDYDNRRVRVVDLKTGLLGSLAGTGQMGAPADGADARTSPLLDARAVAADSKGNVYILERAGNVIRVVDGAGKIRTVVGSGKAGASGDGGDALAATMNGPRHIFVDRDDNVLIADTENSLVRKYIPAEHKIVRVAGNGQVGTAGLGGPPESAQLNRPHGVFGDSDGVVYISDSDNDRVLKIVH
jgi:hypothetical protein